MCRWHRIHSFSDALDFDVPNPMTTPGTAAQWEKMRRDEERARVWRGNRERLDRLFHVKQRGRGW